MLHRKHPQGLSLRKEYAQDLNQSTSFQQKAPWTPGPLCSGRTYHGDHAGVCIMICHQSLLCWSCSDHIRGSENHVMVDALTLQWNNPVIREDTNGRWYKLEVCWAWTEDVYRKLVPSGTIFLFFIFWISWFFISSSSFSFAFRVYSNQTQFKFMGAQCLRQLDQYV